MVYHSMKCKARFITAGNQIVSNRQPEYTHSARQRRYCVGTESSRRNESEDGRDERDIEFVASDGGRCMDYRQSGMV